MFKQSLVIAAALTLFGIAPAARAQWAVIDVGAIAQLVQEVQQMQLLLSGTVRNYLPASWPQVSTSLAGPIQSTVNANAVLTPQQWSALSATEQQHLSAARGNAALLQVAAQQAYSTTSGRFNSVQQLINAIPTASDQKGILDLQARIQAEQGMLQNDQTKLQVLFQLVQAQELARRQRTHEQAIADVGSVRSLPPIGLLH